MSIKKILFSQDKPANFEKTPYADLKKNYKVDVDFFKFFSIEGVPLAEFRKQRINILDYSAIIMTSKNAIDQFFRIVEESKIADYNKIFLCQFSNCQLFANIYGIS